jgi:hypothetical protein
MNEDCKHRRDFKYPWHWKKGKIDRNKLHFELKYGDLNKVEPKDLISVALVARHIGFKCHVEFVLNKEIQNYDEIYERAKREIDFFLIEKGERNPIAYLMHHRNQAANFYSDIHWIARLPKRRKNEPG